MLRPANLQRFTVHCQLCGSRIDQKYHRCARNDFLSNDTPRKWVHGQLCALSGVFIRPTGPLERQKEGSQVTRVANWQHPLRVYSLPVTAFPASRLLI